MTTFSGHISFNAQKWGNKLNNKHLLDFFKRATFFLLFIAGSASISALFSVGLSVHFLDHLMSMSLKFFSSSRKTTHSD